MIDDLNTTAKTLGYLTLLIWVILIIYFTLTVARRVQHDWRKKRYLEKVWDNRQSDWIFERKARTDNDIYDYQEELRRDAS
jgi:hypothetical protein